MPVTSAVTTGMMTVEGEREQEIQSNVEPKEEKKGGLFYKVIMRIRAASFLPDQGYNDLLGNSKVPLSLSKLYS